MAIGVGGGSVPSRALKAESEKPKPLLPIKL
jgi:hypothetical protein